MTPEYDLQIFSLDVAKAERCHGRLVPKIFDAHLSRDGVVPVLFESTYASQDLTRLDGTRTIESIQVRSIEAFLRELPIVRAIVEREMTEARKNWLQLESCSAEQMWADTIFSALYLPTRQLIEIEDGGPETISQYSVVFDVGWDDEHGTRMLKFRDGVQIGFGLAGE